MRAVWKYVLKVDDEQEISMPTGAVILHVETQGNDPCLWASVDIRIEDNEIRTFRTYGTGHKYNPCRLTYIGTYLLNRTGFVGHLFEVTK